MDSPQLHIVPVDETVLKWLVRYLLNDDAINLPNMYIGILEVQNFKVIQADPFKFCDQAIVERIVFL